MIGDIVTGSALIASAALMVAGIFLLWRETSRAWDEWKREEER